IGSLMMYPRVRTSCPLVEDVYSLSVGAVRRGTARARGTSYPGEPERRRRMETLVS
ncbi:hypothetical protein LCGC14_2610790, partial [marine sediment metagenome]